MATAIDFPERNDWIGKPEDMSNHQCYALPVCRFITWIPGVIPKAPAQQCLAHVSAWKLTDEEIEKVKETGLVFLKVLGSGMIPASLHGQPCIYVGEGNLSDHILTEEEINDLKGR